ncbi:endocuticle structural glycoprotein SgAbd-8-like [Copidosoma floridanum]|uniref:endocuticle structural glycoprotein SgAbd-8-like n=1 Tax=Copidosoma floridanum TaxID=29053 RepID=UPI0006C9D01D|nr:endocuticle structural glycoprotein SgAbd-8-like [Copidosoma floridanum]
MNQLAILVLVAAFSFANSGPVEPVHHEVVPILHQTSEASPDGSYSYSFETGNGIKVEEQGHVKDLGGEHEAMQVKGSYSYIAPDGTPIKVSYTADENGFHPESDAIPVGPAIPKEIQRALDWIAKQAPADELHH